MAKVPTASTEPDAAVFDSADAARNARPLAHAQIYRDDAVLELESGARLPGVTVCYETYGQLSTAADNAVLVCHAVSGDSHVARHDDGDDPGWWDLVVGPGRAIDTDRYFVICSNVLGGCRGTTGPNFIDPASGRRYGAEFPTVTVGDMVDVEARLIDHLGIARLAAVVGGSLGGFQALSWAVRNPQRLAGCVMLAASPRLSSQALAFDVVGRNAITHDPNFRAGQYYDGDLPEAGLAIARMLAHITYLSSDSMEEKFGLTRMQPSEVATAFEKKFAVGSYLAHQGHKFVERFDANSYVTLSMAMDLFDLGDGRDQLMASLAPSLCRYLLLSFSSDWLYPPAQSREIADALLACDKPVSYCNVDSPCGHDSFLLADSIDRYGRLISGFLAEIRGQRPQQCASGTGKREQAASHVFEGQRLDYHRVLDLVEPGASVLDLGCANGALLSELRARGHRRLVGVEIDEQAVVACVEAGHDVIQSDLDCGLASFADRQFDIAILSQTLQAIEDVATMLDELVRVAAKAIVSFPNFAHRPLREMFYREGRIPKSEGHYGYEWYNSPNRRFPSIHDFEELCAAKSIRIHRRVYLDTAAGGEVAGDANLDADIAIVVITRGADD